VAKEQTVADLSKQLQDLQAKKNQLLGKRDSLLERLKKEFHVSTVAEAEAKIEQLAAQISEQEAEVTKLKAEYDALGVV
jgi:outer membrane murein-binding lipoprotein Lpp